MSGHWMPSTLSSIYDWFTPAVFFVLVHLVIGTIAIVSESSRRRRLASVPELDGGGAAFPGLCLVRSLSRSPSVVLDRLRSFNFNRHYVELSPPLEAEAAIAPAANQASHFRPSEGEEEGEGEDRLNLDRSQSDAQPTAREMPPKLAVRIKKSASEKSAFSHFEREEIEDAAATPVPEVADAPAEGDEVDARADDFIHRFRQQLKLQRLDSILRYKEMLGRRSA